MREEEAWSRIGRASWRRTENWGLGSGRSRGRGPRTQRDTDEKGWPACRGGSGRGAQGKGRDRRVRGLGCLSEKCALPDVTGSECCDPTWGGACVPRRISGQAAGGRGLGL